MKNKYVGAAVIGGIATAFSVFLGSILNSVVYQLYYNLTYATARVLISVFDIAIWFAAMFASIKIYGAITKTQPSGGKTFGVAIGAAFARE